MERPNNGPKKKGSGGLWLLGGLAAVVVVKNNPEILDWLVAIGEGLKAHGEKKAIQLLETQKQEFLIPQSPQPNPEPPMNDFAGAYLAEFEENIKVSSTPLYIPPVDEPLVRLVHHPLVVVIVGGRDSGKSALAIRIQELLRDTAAPYAVGLPPKAERLLPSWYGLAQDFDTIPSNSVIYVQPLPLTSLKA